MNIFHDPVTGNKVDIDTGIVIESCKITTSYITLPLNWYQKAYVFNRNIRKFSPQLCDKDRISILTMYKDFCIYIHLYNIKTKIPQKVTIYVFGIYLGIWSVLLEVPDVNKKNSIKYKEIFTNFFKYKTKEVLETECNCFI